MYQAFLIHVFDSVLRGHHVHDEFEAELKRIWLPLHSQSGELILFHYTDVFGLKGIVGSKELWATDARFLNDRSEIDHGRELILKKIDERASKSSSEPTKVFLEDVASQLKMFFKPTFYRVFIACFCEEQSLLSQWRAYSEKGGGYALGFDFSDGTQTIKALADQDQYQRIALRKVIYCDKEKHNLVEVLLDKACDFFHKLMELPEFENLSDAPLAAGALVNILGEMIYCFKDWSFREEKEWRLVRVIQVLESRSMSRACKFRPRGQYIVPYVPTPLFNITENGSTKVFPLKSIVLGPTVELMRSKLSLQHFCSSGANPYGIELDGSKVGIDESGIPYRGSS